MRPILNIVEEEGSIILNRAQVTQSPNYKYTLT